MEEKEEPRVSDIYQGGYSSFKPDYGNFVGYHIPAGDIGLNTDARTANILKAVNDNINPGGKTVEVTQVFPEIFDAVPKQQLEEVNRLSKLTGIDLTFHAPVVGLDPSGMDKQGRFSEIDRRAVERQMLDAVKRGHELNPDGNLPIIVHASQGPPGTLFEMKDGKKITKKLIAINRDSKQIAPLEEDIKYYPDMRERKDGIIREIPLHQGKKYTPEDQLNMINDTEWDDHINKIIFNKEKADEILRDNATSLAPLMKEIQKTGEINPKNLEKYPDQRRAYLNLKTAETYLDDSYRTINSVFSKAYEFGDEHQKKALVELSNKFKEDSKNIGGDIIERSEIMQSLLLELKKPKFTPEMYIPIEEFVTKESGKTFGNVAFDAYKKFKDKTPFINIENSYSGGAITSGKELRAVIEESRKNFIEKAVNNGMSRSEAEDNAKKFIGATWDVGRLNTLRKQGWTEKDLIKESENIAPMVKHVHLSDNFGFEGTELPMGMGNVPIKEIMEKLGKEGFEGKKVVEAMHWWQHFSPQGSPPNSPLKPTMEAFGSPIYSMEMSPSWNQSMGLYQDYLSQNVPIYSQTNQQLFGTSFSQLPMELGGQNPNQGGRMSGRPME